MHCSGSHAITYTLLIPAESFISRKNLHAYSSYCCAFGLASPVEEERSDLPPFCGRDIVCIGEGANKWQRKFCARLAWTSMRLPGGSDPMVVRTPRSIFRAAFSPARSVL